MVEKRCQLKLKIKKKYKKIKCLGTKLNEDNRETLAKEDEAGCVCLLFY